MANLAPVIRELGRVQTNGQARAAVGATTRYLSDAYAAISDIPWTSGYRDTARRDLDGARLQLEGVYPRIASDALGYPVDPRVWAEARKAIERAYIAAEGVYGAASYESKTSLADILVVSLKEAPGVFARAVGEVAAGVGNTAGSVVGGLFSGLGLFWTLILLLGAGLLVFGKLKGIV
jgi:hypothetical protein